MSKEAASTGKTAMGHFMSYGNRYFGRMFVANIILTLILSVALIFWIPAFYVIYNSGLPVDGFIIFLDSPESFFAFFATLLLSAFFGTILTIIYGIIVIALFLFVGYSIVIDDISVIGSFKKSLSLLKTKTSQVLLFFAVLFILAVIYFVSRLIISTSVGFIFGMIFIFLSFFVPAIMPLMPIFNIIFSSIINVIFGTIVAVVLTVWIARFYMAITEKQLYVEEKLTNY